MRLRTDRVGRFVAVGLAGLVVLAPLAIGSVHRWASGLLEIALVALGAAWFHFHGGRSLSRGLVFATLALGSFLVFQIVPLPPAVLEALSPAAAELRRRSAAAIEATPDAEIGPVAAFEDGRAPVAVRQRIRELANQPRGWFPADWHPIALYPFAAKADLLRYVVYGVAFWLAATLPAGRLLLHSLFVSGVAAAAIAIVQHGTWNGRILWVFAPYDTGPISNPQRMMGPFVNPDHLGAYCAMTLAVGAALLIENLRRQRRLRRESRSYVAAAGLGMGLAVIVAALFGSVSRGGILGGLLALATFWWATSRDPSRTEIARRRREPTTPIERIESAFARFAPGLLALAIVIVGLVYAGPKARSMLDSRIVQTVSSPDLGFRGLLVRATVPMLLDFPLAGVGGGGWEEVFPRYARYPIVGVKVRRAHNDYIEWAAEVGAVGVLLTVAVVWALAGWLKTNPSIPYNLRWGIVAAIVAIGWQELFDFALRTPAVALAFAVLLGLAGNRRWREEPPDEPTQPSGARRVAVLAAAACLTWAAANQVREFIAWASVRAGNPNLAFAPADAETWQALAELLNASGFRYRPPTAEAAEAALSRRPASAESFWLLARASPAYSQRLRALDAAVFLDPTNAALRLDYARMLAVTGQVERALAEVEEAAYRDPRRVSHPYLEASAKEPYIAYLSAAERGFQRALVERPSDVGLIDEIAGAYFSVGQWEEAATLWLRAAEVPGDWNAYSRRAAESFARAEKYATAEDLLRKGIAGNPADAEAYRILALRVLAPQGKLDDARKTLEKGMGYTLDPSLPSALYEVEKKAGNEKAAVAALARAAELRPLDSFGLAQLAQAYAQAGDLSRARKTYDRAIQLDAGRADLYFHRGEMSERLHDFSSALDSYRKAVSLEPSNPNYPRYVAQIERTIAEAATTPRDATR